MFIDGSSEVRWIFPIKSKDNTAEALLNVTQEFANREGLSCGSNKCDGGRGFKDRFEQVSTDPGIKITTNVAYTVCRAPVMQLFDRHH